MKKAIILLSALIIWSCANKEEKQKPIFHIDLKNTIDQAIADAPIIIKKAEFTGLKIDILPNTTPVFKDNNGSIIPFQTDDLNGDGNWDEYALVADFSANETKTLEVVLYGNDTLPIFKSSTNVHLGRKADKTTPVEPVKYAKIYKDQLTPYQANQIDGPGWENSLVGYRLYFDGRNMRDVFGKQQPAVILPEVGLSEDGNPVDNYHALEDWGRDVLSVGNSLGAGGLAFYEDGTLTRLGLTRPETIDNVDSSEYILINTGPIRAIFDVNYYGWDTPIGKLNVHNRISIWKGRYGYMNKTTVTGFEGKETIVTGLVNSNNDQPITEKQVGDLQLLATHDKQTYDKEYFLGLALAVPNKIFQGWEDAPETGKVNTTRFAKLNVSADAPFTYYVFSGWELQDTGFTQKDYFMEKIDAELVRIQNPIEVSGGMKENL